MITQKVPKNAEKLRCESCDFTCSKKSNWEKHLLTSKHKKDDGELRKKIQKLPNKYNCVCGKEYCHRQGLWKHKQLCTEPEPELAQNNIISQEKSPEEVKTLSNMVMELMKSNSDLQKQLVDVCKNNNNTNNTIINSNNKTFNLNFFLNEQCKDAMNISDFVNTFDLQLEDLESVGELGYVEGMTKIIVDKLNSMDIYKRPMHCSDAKREIIYIKDENIWAREERTNPKLRQAIKTVTFRNMKQVKKWSDKHPESLNNESHLNDKYMMLVIQSTGGNGLIGDSENKIIRRIVKEIVIGKNI